MRFPTALTVQFMSEADPAATPAPSAAAAVVEPYLDVITVTSAQYVSGNRPPPSSTATADGGSEEAGSASAAAPESEANIKYYNSSPALDPAVQVAETTPTPAKPRRLFFLDGTRKPTLRHTISKSLR